MNQTLSEDLKNGETILEIKNVHKSFGEKKVHQGINLELKKGEILALLGGSGTGKSVILRSIIGLEKPDEGSILFEGKDITKFSEKELIYVRKKIGYAFQNGALFDSMTVEENLAYPLLEHTNLSISEIKKLIDDMLALIGMQGSNKLLPSSLSGGMQKRVGVARSIILKPQIILYDEPTAGLDPFNTQRLIELMNKIRNRERNTAIFVTHDLQAAFQVSDRVAILNKGKIHIIDTVENVKNSTDPFVQHFLKGEEFE
jgi:phospholipid/cholesterol/gamma-HCH transport system ATP-binding protein